MTNNIPKVSNEKCALSAEIDKFLNTLGNRDGSIDANEVPKNKDGYFDYGSTKLSDIDFLRLQSCLFRNNIVKLRSPKKAIPHSGHKYLDSLEFLFDISKKNYDLTLNIVTKLGIDLSNCKNASEFARELAFKLNTYVKNAKEPDKNLFGDLTKILNKIHEHSIEDGWSDEIREHLFHNLNDKAVYWLICFAKDELFTSTVIGFWRHKDINNAVVWLRLVDPELKYVEKFTRKMARFGLTEPLANNRNFFLEIAEKVILNSDEPIIDAAIMTYLYEDLLPKTTDAEKIVLFGKWLEAYNNKDSNKHIRRCFSFLIKYYGEKFRVGEINAPLKDIIKRLPEIPTSNIPRKTWISDGKISAGILFYNDQNWFSRTASFYTKRGWKSKRSGSGKTVTFTSNINDVKLEVMLKDLNPNSNSDRKKAFDDHDTSWDIVVHRGHSFTSEKAFPHTPYDFSEKLLFDGSCGSFGSLISSYFVRNYRGNFFVGDINVANGGNNIKFIYELMRSVANGNSSWEVFDKDFKKTGLVFPNHPTLLLGQYATDHAK